MLVTYHLVSLILIIDIVYYVYTGSTLIAALKQNRNCLAIELDGIQYATSKVSCLTVLNREEGCHCNEEAITEELDEMDETGNDKTEEMNTQSDGVTEHE